MIKLDPYNEWYESQTIKIQVQIDARLGRVESDSHLGAHKHLIGQLWELKFNNGNRIYYTIKRIGEEMMIIILGGNKNGQDKDIRKAKTFFKKYTA